MTFTDACLVRALAVAGPARHWPLPALLAVPRPLVHSGALRGISWHLRLRVSSEGFPACLIYFF